MMKAIIVDDEAASIKVLQEKLENYHDITVAATGSSAEEALRLVELYQPDLMFLDMELPDMQGMELVGNLDSTVRNYCRIIAYTAHEKYMLDAFRNKVFDFLQKPIDSKDLDAIMERLYCENKEKNGEGNTEKMLLQENNGKFLLYTNTQDFRVVSIRDICVFCYNHELRTWEGVVAGFKVRLRLKRNVNSDMLLQLNPDFVQVHQKYIINFNYLQEVTDNICRFYPPFDEIDYVKVGRLFRQKLINRFYSL